VGVAEVVTMVDCCILEAMLEVEGVRVEVLISVVVNFEVKVTVELAGALVWESRGRSGRSGGA